MECSHCGAEFTNNKRKSNKHNFCTKDCYLAFIRTKDRVNLTCDGCGVGFTRITSEVGRGKLQYCSAKCRPRVSGLQTHNCVTCNAEVKRYASLIPKNGNVFCNNSCAAIWKNKHRDPTITTRSKLEKWLEEQLKNTYTDLNILYNKTSEIGMELDIHIPSLNLAFEINGVFHYEDVFNNGLLVRRLELDEKKRQLCIENKITLIEIDTREQKYFTEKSSKKYLEMVTKTINAKFHNVTN
jgi:hypothetical protein